MTKIAKLVARNVNPRFSHDCARCLFVGQLDGEDLYACGAGGEASLVRRFGDDGPDYGSLPAEFRPEGSAYALAGKLADLVCDGAAPSAWRTA
jgi:hypothetical protein